MKLLTVKRREVSLSWSWRNRCWFDLCRGGDRCLEHGEWGVQVGPVSLDARWES